jgi:hypothetical protein
VPDRNQLKAYMERLYGVYSPRTPGWKGVRYIMTTEAEAEADGDDGGNSDVE